jgi:para-aminobenzoate synthetase component II
MLLVIDNYDSFVHNLARYLALAGWDCKTVRNDEIKPADIETLKPQAIVISPGPCAPAQAGISVEAVRRFGSSIPLLGVCLGHQCIGEAYGARIRRAAQPVHGQASEVFHDGLGIFENLPYPLSAGRYHSLVVEPDPDSPLEITARTADGEIMAVRHREHPAFGVQFHPESILTPGGARLIQNFTALALRWNRQRKAA